jgi:hypothetical protein
MVLMRRLLQDGLWNGVKDFCFIHGWRRGYWVIPHDPNILFESDYELLPDKRGWFHLKLDVRAYLEQNVTVWYINGGHVVYISRENEARAFRWRFGIT